LPTKKQKDTAIFVCQLLPLFLQPMRIVQIRSSPKIYLLNCTKERKA